MNITALCKLLHTIWTELLSTARHTLATNELAQGGLLTSLLSAAALYARTLPAQLLSRLDRRFAVTLDIQGDDLAFPWRPAWLGRTAGYSPRGRPLSDAAAAAGRLKRLQITLCSAPLRAFPAERVFVTHLISVGGSPAPHLWQDAG